MTDSTRTIDAATFVETWLEHIAEYSIPVATWERLDRGAQDLVSGRGATLGEELAQSLTTLPRPALLEVHRIVATLGTSCFALAEYLAAEGRRRRGL